LLINRSARGNKLKILTVGDFSEDFFRDLANFGELTKATEVEDNAQLDDFDILLIRSETKVDKGLTDRMRNLKCVISATHGVDHVSVDCLQKKGVKFHNVPVQSYDIAQGVMAHILAHSTNLIEGDRSMKQRKWKKRLLKGFRIKGKTLGIIGYGRTGKEVARMASALEMNIIVYDPYVKDNEYAVTLNELLSKSDFITVHAPLTEETRNMIGKKEIEKMKDGVFLINTARGGIINEEALLDALCKGKLSGAALDVYRQEPPFLNDVSDKLVRNRKVTATPHSIGQTKEAMAEKEERVLKIVMNYVREDNSG
jgi:D-3-phosphoglycerate dehydrogenase